jgi:hypothetical protein
LCAYLAPKRTRIDVVDERPLPVDLDHGEPLAVLRLEPLVTGDVDLVELDAGIDEDAAGPLAEVAAGRVVEDDARDRSRA